MDLVEEKRDAIFESLENDIKVKSRRVVEYDFLHFREIWGA